MGMPARGILTLLAPARPPPGEGEQYIVSARRRIGTVSLVLPLFFATFLALTPSTQAQHLSGTPTPLGTLPPGPTVNPVPLQTLPPGPVRNQTFFYPATALYVGRGGHWRRSRTIALHAPAKFSFCYTANRVRKPAAQLTLQHGHAKVVEAVVSRYTMHKVSVKGKRYCFARTLRLNSQSYVGSDTAGFIVVDGRAPVAPFTFQFRVTAARKGGSGKG